MEPVPAKSRLAEQTAIDRQLAVTYVATAQALDPEMQSRITHHQNQRPSHWSLVEEPLYLAKILQKLIDLIKLFWWIV